MRHRGLPRETARVLCRIGEAGGAPHHSHDHYARSVSPRAIGRTGHGGPDSVGQRAHVAHGANSVVRAGRGDGGQRLLRVSLSRRDHRFAHERATSRPRRAFLIGRRMDPVQAYTGRQQEWRSEAARHERLFIRIGNLRLLVALAAVAIAALAYWRGTISAWWLLLPLVAFIGLLIWHERVVRRRNLAQRAIRYYERGLARLTDAWAGTGNSGDQFRNAEHVYADDLDVFGRGSLFELISTARTGAGERTLASWLLAPADRVEAVERQGAVRELCSRLDLREDLALLGDDIRAEVHADMLEKWGSAAPVPFSPALRIS